MAKNMGGEVVTSVKDYYGNQTEVDIGIKNSVFQRGLGFTVEGEEVKIVGDTYQIPQHHVTNFQNTFNQLYTQKAWETALKQSGYSVVPQKVGNKVLLKAWAI